MNHILNAQQFSRALITDIFSVAHQLEKTPPSHQPLSGSILASLFYEPSTRTRFSFESAMFRLGGSIISTENAKEFSSAAKGETLEDTIRVVSSYADIIVLRHPDEGASDTAAYVSEVPVINAGDGTGQHPTQALLDLYTIEKEVGSIDGVHVALVGDLRHGRTVRSLAYLLTKYRKVSISLVSPPSLKMRGDITSYLDRKGVQYGVYDDLRAVLPHVDVVYQTRIQKERFNCSQELSVACEKFGITTQAVQEMKEHAVIMHPLPRVDEISREVDLLPNAAYFRQAQYGVTVRKALLRILLGR